jgi:hypothetical protein
MVIDSVLEPDLVDGDELELELEPLPEVLFEDPHPASTTVNTILSNTDTIGKQQARRSFAETDAR